MTKTLKLYWRPKEIELLGQRALITEFVVPPGVEVPDDLATAIRLRKVVYEGGQCPACGARAQLPPRAARRRAKRLGLLVAADVDHKPHCLALLRGWDLVDGGPV